MAIVSDLIAGHAGVNHGDQPPAPDFTLGHVQQQAELAIFAT